LEHAKDPETALSSVQVAPSPYRTTPSHLRLGVKAQGLKILGVGI